MGHKTKWYTKSDLPRTPILSVIIELMDGAMEKIKNINFILFQKTKIFAKTTILFSQEATKFN